MSAPERDLPAAAPAARNPAGAPESAGAPYGPAPRGPSPFWRIKATRSPSLLRASIRDELSLMPSPFQRFWTLALLVAVLVAPFTLTDFWLSVLNFAAIASIGAIGLNLLTGFTGQVSLGHAFFIGLGAYTAAYAGGELGWPVVVWLPLAGLLGAAVGLAIGPFALRLKGLYLAIVTIGLVFLGEHLFLNVRGVTGGPQGRSVPSPEVAGFNFARIGGLSRDQSFFLFLVPLVILAIVFAKNVVRSRAGRALQAIRDREIAASIIGVNLARYKVGAFALSSFYAAAAGALYGSYLRYAQPERFNLLFSIEFVAMIIVGGIGTVFGSVLGALFIVMLPRLIEQVGPLLPFVAQTPGSSGLTIFTLNQMIFGALIVFFLVFEPAGLAGIWMRLKVYFKSWPFSY